MKHDHDVTEFVSDCSSCTLNMFKFPYDTQYCSLNFGNIIEPAELINITWDIPEVGLNMFSSSNEFDVKSQRAERVTHEVCISAFLSLFTSVLPAAVVHRIDVNVSHYCVLCIDNDFYRWPGISSFCRHWINSSLQWDWYTTKYRVAYLMGI